jgi:hypothetical protein
MTKSFFQNKWKILTFALVGVILLGAIIPQANAATDISQIIQKIYNIVSSADYGNQAIKNAIGNGASQASVNTLQTDVTALKASQYVPFSVMTSNSESFVCVSNGTLNDHDHINISSGADIIINSVIIEPDNVINPDDVVASGFITVNGHQIFISTGGLSPTGNTASNDAFDIMTSTATYPHQVAGSTIDFELVCQHDTDNDSINFEKIIVSGWKKAGSTVSVSYQE